MGKASLMEYVNFTVAVAKNLARRNIRKENFILT